MLFIYLRIYLFIYKLVIVYYLLVYLFMVGSGVYRILVNFNPFLILSFVNVIFQFRPSLFLLSFRPFPGEFFYIFTLPERQNGASFLGRLFIIHIFRVFSEVVSPGFCIGIRFTFVLFCSAFFIRLLLLPVPFVYYSYFSCFL